MGKFQLGGGGEGKAPVESRWGGISRWLTVGLGFRSEMGVWSGLMLRVIPTAEFPEAGSLNLPSPGSQDSLVLP